MSEQAVVPIIDISPLFGSDAEKRLATANLIGKACADIGFFIIVGHQVDPSIVENAWTSTRQFFDNSLDYKMQFVKPQHEYPFGYSPIGGEVLSAGKAAENANAETKSVNHPDLKEMFSLGPKDPKAGFPERLFPNQPAEFAQHYEVYYETLATLAREILKAFALTLQLEDENFFEQFVDHHASALRAIHYPAITADSDAVLPGQLRASAHTDYGTITILKSDGPGLQVSKDKFPPTWYDVPHVADGFVINLGDLMRRWTNEKWLSTLHRVVIPSSEVSAAWGITNSGLLTEATASTNENSTTPTSEAEAAALNFDAARKLAHNEVMSTKRRQSMAFFHNLNRDAVVSCILREEGEVAKHEPIVAGDFLMQKHLASVQAAASK